MPVLDQKTCDTDYNGEITDAVMFCAGKTGKDSCQVSTNVYKTRAPRILNHELTSSAKFQRASMRAMRLHYTYINGLKFFPCASKSSWLMC